MQRCKQTVLQIALVLGLFFVINVVILFNLLPTSTVSNLQSPPIISGQSFIKKSPNVRVRDTYSSADQSLPRCYDFGCPLRPPELDNELRHVLSQAFENNVKNDTFPFGTSKMAMLSQIGKSHRENQDRAIFIRPFGNSPRDYGESFLIGIFDGHGVHGHIIADYVATELPVRLWEKLEPLLNKNRFNYDAIDEGADIDAKISQALNETFVDVDINAPPNALKGGCTASVTLGLGSKLYIANAGDSQTIIVTVDDNKKNGNIVTSIPFMTRKDKALIPEEKARIEGLGGKIHISPHNDSRVVVYSVTAREQISLAMSRSIGDWEWKVIGVIAQPLVNVIDLSTLKNAFIIAASDGLWDVRRREFYAKQFAEPLYHGQSGPRGTIHPLHRLWEVIEKVTPKVGYQDDITAILMKLDSTSA